VAAATNMNRKAEPGRPTNQALRRTYASGALVFAAVTIVALPALPLQMLLDNVLPIDEAAAYMMSSFGAVAAGLALVCVTVAYNTTLSTYTALPLAGVCLALAYIRYLEYFFGGPFLELARPLVLAEILLFNVMAVIFGCSRADAPLPTPRAHAIALFADGFLRTRPVVRAWLVVLTVVLFIVPIFFLPIQAARMMILGQALHMFVVVIYSYRGFSRLLGLSHLLAWTPALAYMGWTLYQGEPAGVFAMWLWTAVGVGGVCLFLDVVDLMRYALGDRASLIPGHAHNAAVAFNSSR